MERPVLLDLFCGAGLSADGYAAAGFDVIGVDIRPQPHYPFRFVNGDALDLDDWPSADIVAVHASPPCQQFSTLRRVAGREYDDLIDATRAMLRSTGLPYVMENVVGSPLDTTLMLCGSSFGLAVRRHRLFETSFVVLGLPCDHTGQGTPLGVYGTGTGRSTRRGKRASRANGFAAMGVADGRCTWRELSQGVPPAYTEHIGRQMIGALS